MACLSHRSSSPLFIPNFQTPQFHKIAKVRQNSRTIFPVIVSTSASESAPIFLPFLQNPRTKETQQNAEEISDPMMKFFKTRASEPDSVKEGRITLQKNRKISWHLSPDMENHESEYNDLENHQPISAEVETVSSMEGIVEKVLGIARNLPENVTLVEELERCDLGDLTVEDCVKVLKRLGKEEMVMDCLYFFEWMRLNQRSLLTPRACSVLFPILGRAGKGEELLVLFKNLPFLQNFLFRDVHVYNAAISGLSFCKRFDDAWKVFESMETSNIKPDHVTCSIMITIMSKKGSSAKDVWSFFEMMSKKGVKWSVESSGALIKAFCDEGLKREALIIQSLMEKRGIGSNAVIYNTIMNAYRKSNQIEEAEGLFSEMKMKGIKPTNASYNILMDAYSARIQPETVETLLQEMEKNGLEPNVRSFTCLISAYGKRKGMSEMASNAFLRMKKAGIKPTSYSYTALNHAYSVDKWHEKAFMAFENMVREGVKPSIETYTALLDAFRRAGDTETLTKIWKMMMKDRVEGTRVTFDILLDGFAKKGHYTEARDVIFEFGKLGFEPNVVTYNMLINAYARGMQESKIPQLLKEMAARNLKPDSITYSTMIYAYVRVRDFKRAFFYHKLMVKSGQIPDAESYGKLRAILDVKAKIKNRKDKSALMGIIKSSMGLMKEKRKTKKDEFWKNRKNRPITHRSER